LNKPYSHIKPWPLPLLLLATVTFAVLSVLCSCGIYKLNGANVEGKTINIHIIENRAPLVNAILSPTLTEKLRQRILNQTNLQQQNTGKTDYDLSGTITGYDIGVSAVQNAQASSQNKITVVVEINFVNNIDPKKSFKKNFTKFAVFDASRTLQQVERQLAEEICSDLSDAVFNDAFVNW
jgi:hypothetical protein